MRVMVLVKATEASEACQLPSPELLAEMGAYNEELIAAGIMRDGGGLRPTHHGRRVALDNDDRPVRTGPFPRSESLVSGFWIWEVRDMDEALAWARRCPTSPQGPHELELRPYFQPKDYAPPRVAQPQAAEE